MGFIRKAFNFVVSPTHTRTVLVLFILAAAVPLTVFISQKQQSIKQRASSQSCEANYTPCTNAFNQCSQSCSNLAQSDYGTYEEYTQAYYACTDKCSNDESTCNTDAYNVYLECFSSADSNSASSVNPTPAISQEPSPTPVIIVIAPTPTPTLIPTSVIVENSPTPVNLTPSPLPYCYLKNKGDADCDNKITKDDEKIWEQEFVNELNGIPTAKRSDFNGLDGITIADFNIWKTSMEDSTLPH